MEFYSLAHFFRMKWQWFLAEVVVVANLLVCVCIYAGKEKAGLSRRWVSCMNKKIMSCKEGTSLNFDRKTSLRSLSRANEKVWKYILCLILYPTCDDLYSYKNVYCVIEKSWRTGKTVLCFILAGEKWESNGRSHMSVCCVSSSAARWEIFLRIVDDWKKDMLLSCGLGFSGVFHYLMKNMSNDGCMSDKIVICIWKGITHV